ncbi:hypothetical protein BdWA1_002374 [Babesia duncani]|uniref:Uncharacterized protein n=1 Tax=Babesia duncani TaxID=323732 RepID=A0AAD9PJF7_9APIC|nr:hypothetical protein BdWA1_002374 [Babesia duncani]
MSFQFLANWNKNVQESLSIINEGFQITANLEELNSVHLPQLLLLDPTASTVQLKLQQCCVFTRGAAVNESQLQRNDLVNSNSDYGHGEELSSNSVDYVPENVHLNDHNVASDVIVSKNDSTDVIGCSLGDECLLACVKKEKYISSLKATELIVADVTKLHSSQLPSSRVILEKQSINVLVRLLKLVHVAKFLNSFKLKGVFDDQEQLLNVLCDVLVQTLSLLDKMLTFPILEGIVKNERVTTHTRANNSCNCTNLNVPLCGRINVVSINNDEKMLFDHHLFLIDSCMLVNGGDEIDYLHLLNLGHLLNNYDMIEHSLSISLKVLNYGHLNWHLLQTRPTEYIQWPRLHRNYIHWNMVSNGQCCFCKGNVNVTNNKVIKDQYCSCLMAECNLRYSLQYQMAICRQGTVKILMELLVDPRYNLNVLFLLLVLLSDLDFLNYLTSECRIIDNLCNLLSTYHYDQYYILDGAIEGIKDDNIATLKKDIKLSLGLLPNFVAVILIILECMSRTTLTNVDRNRLIECIGSYCKSFWRLWVYSMFIDLGDFSFDISNVVELSFNACMWLLVDCNKHFEDSLLSLSQRRLYLVNDDILVFKFINTNMVDVATMAIVVIVHGKRLQLLQDENKNLHVIFEFVAHALLLLSSSLDIFGLLKEKIKTPIKDALLGFGPIWRYLQSRSTDGRWELLNYKEISLLQHLLSILLDHEMYTNVPPSSNNLLQSCSKLVTPDDMKRHISQTANVQMAVMLIEMNQIDACNVIQSIGKPQAILYPSIIKSLQIPSLARQIKWTCENDNGSIIREPYDANVLLLGLDSIISALVFVMGIGECYSICTLSKHLHNLYRHPEHVAACDVLSQMDGMLCNYDSMTMDPKIALELFFKRLSQSDHLYGIQITFWYHYNGYEFTMPPIIHVIIQAFRNLLHGHVMHAIVSGSNNKNGNSSVVNNFEIQLEACKDLHQHQLSFAQDKISQLETQVYSLLNFQYLAQEEIRRLKNVKDTLSNHDGIL